MMIISSTPSVGRSERKVEGEKGWLLTHAFTTDDISEPTKNDLTEEISDRGRDFYAEVLVNV
jgi:hypothetical protein